MSVAAQDQFIASLLQSQPALPASPRESLNRLRAEAVDRVGVLTVPTTHNEEWRFTDISSLTKLPLQHSSASTGLQTAIDRYVLPEASARLTFVDGIYEPALSHNESGVIAGDLEALLQSHAASIEAHLGKYATFDDDVFAALNTAFLRHGALIVVPRNESIVAPLHVLHIATRAGAASYPRCLVVAEANSSVTVIEDFVALSEDAYLTDAITEIAIAANASVKHVRVQRESLAAYHVAKCAVSLAHASRYQAVNVSLGARLSRLELNVTQNAEGAECTLDGLALIAGNQLADTHTCIDHAHAHGRSRQVHKCIVDGAAHAVFNGKIKVRAGAQQTDSSQSNRNLLLTSTAKIDAKPQLEIFADDVKCAHGATVGQLDPEELFYLRSRGLSENEARDLLTYAFGAEIIARIDVPTLKAQLETTVLARTHTSS